MVRKSKKRLRIGSDENTRSVGDDDFALDVESRFKEMERRLGEMSHLFDEIKKRDERIAELEREVAQMKKSATSTTSEKPSVEITDHDLLIIGDSIVKSVDLEKLDPKKNSTLVCVHGGTPRDVANQFKEISTKKRFKRVIVHVGTNLIPKFSKNFVVDKINECMLEIRKHASPTCKVAFSGILPKFNDGYLRDIDWINFNVWRSGSFGPPSVQYGYVEHFSFFVGKNGKVDPKLLNKDAIHLSSYGANIFTKSLKRLTDSLV